MGKGSGTSKKGITKKPQRLSGTEAAGGGAGGAPAANACLIRFTGIVDIDSSGAGLRPGQSIVLVQGSGVALDVISSGARVGSFSGNEQSLVEDCMSQGYVYKGVVESVDGVTATCSIRGYGVQNEPASTL